MQQRSNTRLFDKNIGNPLEHFGIERMTERLRLGHCGAHRRCAGLELDADPLAVHCVLVPVPRKTFDANLCDVATEAAVPIDQGRTRTGACGSERCREAARSATHDEHVGFQNDVDRTGQLSNSFH